MILSYLEQLTRTGLWTVGSQPAVDGTPSADEVVGWGPAGGYIYQKSFVEFFATKDKVELLEKKISEQGKGWVDYFACNAEVCSVFVPNIALD
jgi:methylenetetrahydrofolate reductase (NADPH)